MVQFKVLLTLVSSVLTLDKGYSHINFINANGAQYGFNIAHNIHYKGHEDYSKGFDEYSNPKSKRPFQDSLGFTGVAFSRSVSYNGMAPNSIHDRSYNFNNIIVPSAIEYGHIGYPPSKNSIFHPPYADLGYGSPAYGNSHMSGLGYYGNKKYKTKHQ